MTDDRKTPWLALAALSLITAYGLWQIAIRQPDRVQVRFIDLPQATPAALLGSGLDRQTLSEYLELKTSVQMGSAPSTASTLSTPVLMLAAQKEVIPPVPAGRTKPLSAGSKGPTNHRALKVGPVAQRIEQPRPKGKVAGSNPAWPAKLTKAQLAAEVHAALPKLPAAEVDAAVWIIWRESGGRTTAKNPRSSSHGLNGFLRSTLNWGRTFVEAQRGES